MIEHDGYLVQRQLPLLWLCIALFLGCARTTDRPEENGEGKVLVQTHCGGCHMVPDPAALDQATWRRHVLPRMKYILGFRDVDEQVELAFNDYPQGKSYQASSPYFVHHQPVMSESDWSRLKAYILTNAPARLTSTRATDLSEELRFEVRPVNINLPRISTTLVSFLKPGKLMIADYYSGGIFQLNENLTLVKYDSVGMGAVQFQAAGDGYWTTLVGPVFVGTDTPLGAMAKYEYTGRSALTYPVQKLRRPVHASFGDVDQDGREDMVVSEFGKWTGALALFRNTDRGYRRETILPLPGAIVTELIDWDQDGDQDILALMGQAREGVYLFLNDGFGVFEMNVLLEFPPTYGSTHMELVDFNSDGLIDVLYSNGDNGDYVPYPEKPYHGVRLYLNNGNGGFDEKFFVPIPGLYKSMARDFDNDGDLDIATIAFFPTTGQPSFALLTNQGNCQFDISTIPGLRNEKFMTMDVGDYDLDGDEDIVLGVFDWDQKKGREPLVNSCYYLKNTYSGINAGVDSE